MSDVNNEKVEYYDVVEDLNSTDKERMPTRRVLGDISVLQPKVEFMPTISRTWETTPGGAVARDNWLQPNLGESTPPPQKYVCEYPDGQHLHEENFASPDGKSGIAPAADAQFPDATKTLKRAPMFADVIKGFTSGENGS